MRHLHIILFGVLWACSSTPFQQEQESINGLISQYDSLLNSINAINIESAGPNIIKYKSSFEYSKTKLSTKQMPKVETMQYLNNMKLMKRQFKNSSNKKEKLVETVVRNQEQLQNLSNDVSNKIFESEKLNLIITKEQQTLESLKIESYNFSESYKKAEIRFDSLYKLTKTFNY